MIGPRAPCALRNGGADPSPAAMTYRCVIANNTSPTRYNDTRSALLVAPCADTPSPYMAKQRSCACKTEYWFREAHSLYPAARFIGKIEDDAIVHWPSLMTLLNLNADLSMAWFGHFRWSVHDIATGKGKYCGWGDMHLQHSAPSDCLSHPSAGRTDVLAPYATGAFDIRSRDLVAATRRIQGPSFGTCGGGQGIRVTDALAGMRTDHTARAFVTIVHLLGKYYRRTPPATVSQPTTMVVHPYKLYTRHLTWNFSVPVENATACMTAGVTTNRHGQTVLAWQRKQSGTRPEEIDTERRSSRGPKKAHARDEKKSTRTGGPRVAERKARKGGADARVSICVGLECAPWPARARVLRMS